MSLTVDELFPSLLRLNNGDFIPGARDKAKRIIRFGIMKTRKFWIIATLIVLSLTAVATGVSMWWKARNRVHYRTAKVTKGTIIAVVNATGTIQPTRSVQVGSFVSGPIEEIHVDFNDEVKKGDLLAVIDPRIYVANMKRDEATLKTRLAEVEQVRAQLQRAINDEMRSKRLRAEDVNFISDTEMDQFKFNRMALEAQLTVAEMMVEQARANLEQSTANVGYTKIRSPVDGIIIDRKIDPGQTVASQFQTPELFIVAPRMREEMHVFASVDEADIGLVRSAQESGRPVEFTVDAYPDDLFVGKIYQIRQNSTTVQNVVTYPVVVSVPNPDLKLLPGMTASISFQVGKAENVLRIPNAALRFYPQRDQVHPDDRYLLEGREFPDDEEAQRREIQRSAKEKADLRRRRNRRHVWVQKGDYLRAIEVITGLSDSNYTEAVSGELHEGQELITGILPKSRR
ncbi:MAG: RND transporter [Gemmatales bacterium]|nr:MAG: RND transporter [Gemmatales bacterium]